MLTTPRTGFKFNRSKDGGTKLSSARTESKLGKDRKEERDRQSVRSAFSLEESSDRHRRYSRDSCSCKQCGVTIATASIISLLVSTLCVGSLVAYLENQRTQLQESDSSVAHDAQVADADITKMMADEIERLHQNFTQTLADQEARFQQDLLQLEESFKLKITEVEANSTERLTELDATHTRELQDLNKSLKSTQERLTNVTAKIEEVENMHTMEFAEMKELLNVTEINLAAANSRITEIDAIHSSQLEEIDRELNDTISQLSEAKIKITQLDSELQNTSIEVDYLNSSKASVISVAENSNSLLELDREKAAKTELEVVFRNLTQLAETSARGDDEIWLEIAELSDTTLNETHRDQIHNIIAMFASSKVNQSDFDVLVARVTRQENTAAENLAELERIENSTVEVRVNVEQLSLTVDQLVDNTSIAVDSLSQQLVIVESTKVDVGEFETLSTNVTILSRTTSQRDRELRDEIDDLTDGSINRTHHDELQDIVNMFAQTKANQSDLETLSNFVSTLSITVQQTQGNVTQLHTNLSRIETMDQALEEELQTKAEEEAVTLLTDRVTTLEDTSVELRETVTSLKQIKANKTALGLVKERVRNLDRNMTDHISASADFDSDIKHNKDDIKTNTRDITNIKNSSFLPLASSFNTLLFCVSLTIMFTLFH